MVRLLLIVVVVLTTACPAWGQRGRLLGGRLRARLAERAGRVSVNVGSPYSRFYYEGQAPHPYAYGYGYEGAYDGYGSPYGAYYNPQAGYVEFSLPPVYYPGELMYGPQAVRRFFGLDRPNPVPARPPAVAERAAEPEAAEPLEPPALKVRESNAASRERAEHFLTAGDQLFREQRYQEALQRYKSAAQWTPDRAAPFFRQGFALVATNRYGLAADAFRRALAVEPAWAASAFRLDELYGEAALAKQAHLDALARAGLHAPEDADLMFVLGVFLHFDGQQERARKFFTKARELDADGAPYIEQFLAAAP